MENHPTFYKNIFEKSPIGLTIYDSSGQCIDCNNATCEIINATKEQVLSQNFHHIELWKTSGLLKKAIEALTANKTTQKHITLTSTFNKKLTANVTFSPLSSESETFLLCTFDDLTTYKELEGKLYKTTNDLNERVKELDCLYGLSQLVERDLPLENILQGIVELISPSWQYPKITAAQIKMDDQAYRTDNFRETKWFQSQEIVVFGEKKGGIEVYYLEEIPTIDEGPFLQEERRLINAIAERIGHIIERKKGQDFLKESRELLIQSQEVAHLGSWQLDRTTNVLIWSDEVYRIFGLHPKEFTLNYEAFLEAVHPEDRDLVGDAYSHSLLEGIDSYDVEYRVIRKNSGEIRYVHERCQHYRDINGSVIRSVGMVQDITKNKLSEQTLLRYQKQMENVAKIGTLANSTLSLDGVLEGVLNSITKTLNASAGMIFLKDPVSCRLQWGASLGLSKAFVRDLQSRSIQPGEGLTGSIAQSGDPIYIKFDSSHDSRIVRLSMEAEHLNSFIGVPLFAADKIIGVMNILTHSPDILTENDMDLCTAVGSHVGLAIRNAQLFEKQKQAEGLLRESEERFRELFNNMSSGVAIYDATEDGDDFIFKDINSAGLDSSQLERHQLIGKSVQDVFPAILEMGLFDVFQRVWKTGLPEHFPSTQYMDNRITLWVENYVCKIPSGELVAIYEDVTDRKKEERELIRTKEEWTLTFDAMSDIVTIQDKNMRIVQANRAAHEFCQKKREELKGKQCYEIFTGMAAPCRGCPLLSTLEDIGPHSEVMYHKSLGKTFLVSSAVITDDDGEVQYLVHVAKDITEQKKLEEELFQTHKMEAMGTLAGGIAHDFNNILAAILGFAELAQLNLPVGSNASNDIDQVIVSGERAADLVQQILTFSRKSEHCIESIRPHLIIKEALKMLRSSLPASIAIREDIDTECGKAMADPTNIHQIIVNLCTNALHAMENEKGILSVSLQRKEISAEEITGETGVSQGSFIVLEVSDTGQGMTPATIDRIFEPYFTTKEVGKGTGLGLAVIHGIIQEYHGFIRVQSELGKGTSFQVHIPSLQEEISTVDKTETPKSLPSGTEQILIVDDEAMIVNLNKLILERLGYTVSKTTDSLDALEKIRTNPDQFDLIITDQTMPELTGAELSEKILAIRPDMPIILCTGYSSVLSREDALLIGIKKYVRKPVDRAILAKAVRQVLDEK